MYFFSMRTLVPKTIFPFLVLLFSALTAIAQPDRGVYLAKEIRDSGIRHHLLKISSDYLIHSIYDADPAHFIRTRGGYFRMDEDDIKITLEFDSEKTTEAERELTWNYGFSDGYLILNGNTALPYTQEPEFEQPIDGQWLFATRGPDTGQERRGDENPRKTLKFLMDGYFQWIAYNTETFEFFGSGGGRYAAENGNYTEVIEFFSRDNTRVGAELGFEFERKGNDWHHSGLNSKGEPLYEIWTLRNPE